MQPVIIDIRNGSKIKIEKSVGEERLSGLALMNIHNGEVNFDIDKLCVNYSFLSIHAGCSMQIFSHDLNDY